VVHQIIARDTIDEAIVSAINSKDKTQQALMNAVRDYSKQVKEREEIN
jgi:CHASE3 domain sensor protein